MRRVRAKVCLGAASVALGGIVVSGCASTVNGHGSGQPSSSSSSSSVSSSPVSSSSSAPSQSCAGAHYCDDFSNASSGWPSEQETHYYADYDTFLGGTYHMGERVQRTVWENAPVKVTSISADYGVTASVDATAGPNMAHDSSAGLVCWEHDTQDGQSASAFLFEVDATVAEVGVWSDKDGEYTSISKKNTTLFSYSSTNHLTIGCAKSGTQAHLTMSVNGQSVLDTTYAAGGASAPWKVGDGVGLVAGGKGSDIFYDNFGVNPA